MATAADILRREARQHEAELHVLETDRQRFVLSPKAKARYQELPGIIAGLYARADEAEQLKNEEEAELVAHYEGAVSQYIGALQVFTEAKQAVDSIRAEGRASGVYLQPIEVRAHTDRALYKLLERARATALA
jgi:hypothetical protein